jgi:GTP-binding protein Era
MTASFRAGLITVVGRPNVGKSTLINRLVGQKVTITSRRPQTTRHRIMGIKTRDDGQLVFVDTPGIHGREGKLLGRYMSRVARASMEGVDCIVFVITAAGWRDEDERVLDLLRRQTIPVILVINKIDKLASKEKLLPLLEACARKMEFADVVPVSAEKGTNVDVLETVLLKHLPEQPPIFPEDQLTDRNVRFLAAELVREQVFRAVGEEVPYSVAVEIERYKEQAHIVEIGAVIWVEKEGQKGIIIGKGGQRLKSIGSAARVEIEKLLGTRVHLELWVKTREGWADSDKALRSLGFDEDG